jgi:hypothetical protein
MKLMGAMISKPIHEVGLDDLQALLDNGVRESKTIEYKLELPGNADSEKARFLASVSSLANTAGGDHLFGVRANQGLPEEFPGVATDDPDADKLRLEQVLANGLEPRLPRVDIQTVEVEGGRHVFVLRVPKSWVSPHRVLKNDKFYGRNAAGKYPLDVGELRTAFTMSQTVSERIRNFRADRVAKVYGRETPVPLRDGGVFVLHLLPLSAFTGQGQVDLSRFDAYERIIRPMGGAQGLDWHVNLDGFVAFEVPEGQGSGKYTQVFRSGAVEATDVLGPRDGEMVLPSTAFEVRLMELLGRFMEVAPEHGITPPVFAFLSMVGVRGCRLGLGAMRAMVVGHDRPLTHDVALVPEIVVEDFGVDPGRALRPAFDVVWNAFGLGQSVNYDADGNWVEMR